MWLRIWLPVQFQNTKPFLATAGVNSKFSVAFTSSLQIFTDVISLKEKQMECIWRITCLEEDVLVVFRRDLTRDMIRKVIKLYRPTELLLWVPCSIHGSNKSKISRTLTGELNEFFSLTWIFFKESTWRLTRRNCFFFFLSPVSTAGRKFGPILLITSDKIKDLKVYRFSLSQ